MFLTPSGAFERNLHFCSTFLICDCIFEYGLSDDLPAYPCYRATANPPTGNAHVALQANVHSVHHSSTNLLCLAECFHSLSPIPRVMIPTATYEHLVRQRTQHSILHK